MTRPCLRALVLLAAVTGLAGAGGQDKQGSRDPQAAIEPRSGPGAGQKFLAPFVGHWAVAKTFFPKDGGPVKVTGTCRQAMTQGGRFLQSDFLFDGPGGKTTGTGLLGFEPETGRFTSVWIDSRAIRMSFRQGREPFDGKAVVLYGAALGPDAAPKYQSRTVTRLEDDGRRIVHHQYALPPDGSERLVMELILTRQHDGPAAKDR